MACISVCGGTQSWRAKDWQLRSKQLPGEIAVVRGTCRSVTEHNEQYNCSVRETQVPEAAGKARSAGFARDSAVHAAKHSGRVFGCREEILVPPTAHLPSP